MCQDDTDSHVDLTSVDSCRIYIWRQPYTEQACHTCVNNRFDLLTGLDKLAWEKVGFVLRLLQGQPPSSRRLPLRAPSELSASLANLVPYSGKQESSVAWDELSKIRMT